MIETLYHSLALQNPSPHPLPFSINGSEKLDVVKLYQAPSTLFFLHPQIKPKLHLNVNRALLPHHMDYIMFICVDIQVSVEILQHNQSCLTYKLQHEEFVSNTPLSHI